MLHVYRSLLCSCCNTSVLGDYLNFYFGEWRKRKVANVYVKDSYTTNHYINRIKNLSPWKLEKGKQKKCFQVFLFESE